jgi:hypothetical protein
VGFANLAAVVDAELAGKVKQTSFRKVPAVVTVAGTWYDNSMAPGNPIPQYYAAAPLNATALARSTDGGIDHGGAVSPSTKHLRELLVLNVTAGGVPQRLIMLDYLAFIPFCDMGTTAEQSVLNPTFTLPRYATGDGVQMMAVLVAPHALANDTFKVKYVNQSGVADRETPLHGMTNATAVNGTLLNTLTRVASDTTTRSPFLCLQAGDTGVRRIQSVTCTAGTDIGLFTLVAVKPLADLYIRGVDAPTEVDYILDRGCTLPEVKDDAYLNFISHPAGSLSGAQLLGLAKFVWS